MTAIVQSRFNPYLLIALIVLSACILLFWLDKDMHQAADYFKPGNLVALAIYFTPIFLLSSLLFKLFSRKYAQKESLFLSLFIGTTIGFILVICSLLALRSVLPGS